MSLILLFGNPESRTILGRISYCLQVKCPDLAKTSVEKIPIIGPSIIRNGARAVNYTFHQKNPLMQIFYAGLIIGGSVIYFIGYSHLVPNEVVGPVHVYLPYLLLGMVVYSFYLACETDPGFITEKTFEKYDHREYDGFLYVKNDCKTCGVRKIPRSKHCKLCNKCVARLDHHCPWLNTCVGEDNYRHFLAFLLMTVTYLLYALYVLGGTILARLLQIGVFEKDFIKNPVSGALIKVDIVLILQFVVYKFPVLVALIILCAVMSVVLFGFFAYHLYLIKNGTTTNETGKWDQVRHFYKNKRKVVAQFQRELEEIKREGKEEIRNLYPDDFLNPDKAPTLLDRMPIEFPDECPKNLYNKGFLVNLSEVLAPMLSQNKHLNNLRLLRQGNKTTKTATIQKHLSRKKAQ